MVKVHKPVGSVFNSQLLMKRKSIVFKDCAVYKFLVCALIKTMIMSYLSSSFACVLDGSCHVHIKPIMLHPCTWYNMAIISRTDEVFPPVWDINAV